MAPTKDGSKWTVEKEKDVTDLVVEIGEVKESVALYNCEGTVVTVKGKCTNVSLTNCNKCAVIVDSVVAAVEVTNCKGAQVQVNEAVPVITIDKTEGCTLHLQSADAQKAEVVTSSATQVNIMIPGATADDDSVELNVPEQFKTVIAGGKTTTTAVEHV